MNEKNGLNCYAPQCSYWDENAGCMIGEGNGGGSEPCDKCVEIYEYKVYAIVERGVVTGIYYDKPPSDLCAEILDLDAAGQDEDENALDAMKARIASVREKYHMIYQA